MLAERSEVSGVSVHKVAATCQSAAAVSPHMLIDSKKGDTTILTTNRQALQKVRPCGVFMPFNMLIFKLKIG